MNTRKKIYFLLFLCLVIIQIYVPVSMIMSYDRTITQGQQFKFSVAPLDPYEPFRGRYVTVRVTDTDIPVPGNVELSNGQTVYTGIDQDDKGFANMAGIYTEPPQNIAYLTTKVIYLKNEASGKKIAVVETPFDRYYMSEKLAPAAEKAYLEHARGNDAYVTVRVLNGKAIVEKLYIKDMPIEEFLKAGK